MRRDVTTVCLLWMGMLGVAGCQNAANSAALQTGYAAFEQKQYDQAARAAETYLKENPSGSAAAEAHYLKGRSIEQRPKRIEAEAQQNLRQARAEYEAALRQSPAEPLASYARTSLGNVCYWMDDYASAERAWREAYPALADEDLKAWVLYRVGLSQQRQGKWAEADDTFADVRRLYPNNEASDRAKAHAGARAFFVQVAAFQSAASAEQLVSALKKRGLPAQRVLKTDRNLQVALLGPLKTYADARAMRGRVAAEHPDAVIVP